MLLLVDENYIAPWDENDPQLMTWVATQRTAIQADLRQRCTAVRKCSAAQADFIVKRKLTCKMIAQWAINVVDARDPTLS